MKACKHITQLLQVTHIQGNASVFISDAYALLTHKVHDGKCHFAFDCWTAPNQRAYLAVTVQYAGTGGVVNEFLLDIIEVAKRHTSENLVVEFAKVLDAFGVSDKVSVSKLNGLHI